MKFIIAIEEIETTKREYEISTEDSSQSAIIQGDDCDEIEKLDRQIGTQIDGDDLYKSTLSVERQ